MDNFKYKTLFKAISEQIDLPDNAVIADLGCKDATFLLAFQEAFPTKIKSAIGVDITDKWFKNVKYKKPIKLKVMNCSKKLKFSDNTFDFVFTKDMYNAIQDLTLEQRGDFFTVVGNYILLDNKMAKSEDEKVDALVTELFREPFKFRNQVDAELKRLKEKEVQFLNKNSKSEVSSETIEENIIKEPQDGETKTLN